MSLPAPIRFDDSRRHGPTARAAGLALGATALAALFALPALAHDTWLLPEAARAEPGKSASFAVTSGMAFPQEETAIAPERVARGGVRLAGTRQDFAARQEGEQALQLKVALARPGIATAWLELHPRTLELTAEDVAHYLEEIAAPAAVVARWQAAPEPRRWRESYRKNVKTFVRVGEPGEDRSWAEPVGGALELVPQSDPTALRAGDELGVRLLRSGSPAAGISVGLVRAGETHGVNATTDAEGRASFRLEKAGWYLLRTTDLRPADGKDLDWESDFATLTFEVKEAGASKPKGGSR